MLRPIESSTRELKSLDGLWRFTIDSPELKEPWKSDLPGTTQCPVPASYNDIFVPNLRNHIGKVWYQRYVRIPRGWHDQRIVIRIDSATHAGEVYVNDKMLASHVGGYMPFEADLTDHVEPGQKVRLTLSVDNTLTNETIPPGQLHTNKYGKTTQRYWHDFFNYGGLHRSVWLFATPKAYVRDITVTTDINGTSGVVDYDIEADGEVSVNLTDEDGKSVATASGTTGQLSVPNAILWAPGKAYLYDLTVSIHGNENLIDEYTLPIGIRTVRVKGTQILINNKPFYFTGFGKHEDLLVKGKGHDDAWMVHDFELMKWTGANSFRTSHYPYDERVLDYADRHGFLVIDETPAVGLNLNIAGGIFGSGWKDTFSPEFANDNTQQALLQVTRELIQRDKNHPCVIAWCLTNEPGASEKGAREFFEPVVNLARQLDPSRPLTYTNLAMVPADKDRIGDLFDIIGLNRYYGWYEVCGDLETAEKLLKEELESFVKIFNKPLLMLEYGSDTVSGLHSVSDLPWSEEYQSDLYKMYHRVFDEIEALRGEQVWNFADFATGAGIVRVDGNKKGTFTRDRKPKAAAHTLRERWTKMWEIV